MSQLSVSSIQNTASATTNLVLNTDGSTTVALPHLGTAPVPTQVGTLWYDCTGAVCGYSAVLIWNGTSWVGAAPNSPATPTTFGSVLGCTTAAVTALGCNALLVNTGTNNVAVGCDVLKANTTGINNTAVGVNALYSNTIGDYNAATGNNALCLSTGNQNTAFGASALRCTTTGNYNTATGASALVRNTFGNNNVAIGIGAMCNNTTGCGNVMVGGTTAAGGYAPVFDPITETNRLMLGSTATTNAYVQVAWTITSDARDKIVEGDVALGLDFVKQLEPKAYRFRIDRNSEEPNGPLRYGFLAQDILALEGANPVIIDDEDANKLRMVDSHLLPVLVNAFKELAASHEALQAEFDAYKQSHP